MSNYPSGTGRAEPQQQFTPQSFNPQTPQQFNPQAQHQFSPQAQQFGRPAPQQFGPQGAQQPAATTAPRADTRNRLGVAALVIGIVGFVFAIWEGAYLVGWILLPIAFILSLVALFQRDKSKTAAAIALVVSIVGSVAGGVAFAGSVGRAFDGALGGNVSPVQQPTQGAEAPAPGDAARQPAPPAGDEQGTRANPYPLCGTVTTDDWQVTVNSFTPDATAAVMAENQFNEPPAAGQVYALVNVTITYLGSESGSALEIGTAYVTSTGNVVNSSDTWAIAPGQLGIDELYTGASVTGNEVFAIPAGDPGVIRVQPGMFADDVFFAIA